MQLSPKVNIAAYSCSLTQVHSTVIRSRSCMDLPLFLIVLGQVLAIAGTLA